MVATRPSHQGWARTQGDRVETVVALLAERAEGPARAERAAHALHEDLETAGGESRPYCCPTQRARP